MNLKGRTIPRKLLSAGAMLLLAAGCVSVATTTAVPATAATASITVNGTQGGRTFDGIGAISGGGGNSRLLEDYPAAEQQQILRLPVQARLRRGPADPEGGDRRRHQLHRRVGVQHRALPRLDQLQRGV